MCTKEKLLVIKLYCKRYKGSEIEKILNRNGSTIRRWKKKWNEKEYEGLKTKRTGGRKPKL